MINKFLKNIFILSFLMFSLNIVYSDILNDIKNRNKLVVAIDIGSPPYGMVDKNAKPIGYDVEVAKLIAKDLGVELEIVPVTGPNRIPYLISKKADIIIAVLSVTEEREKVIDFTIPYAVNPISVAGPKIENIKSLVDLENKTLAITRSTTQDIELTKSSKQFKNINLIRYEDDATTHAAILSGRQKYIASAYSLIMQLKKDNPKTDLDIKFVVKEFPLAIGIRKNNDKLKNYLNDFIKTNIENNFLPSKYKEYFDLEMPKNIK